MMLKTDTWIHRKALVNVLLCFIVPVLFVAHVHAASTQSDFNKVMQSMSQVKKSFANFTETKSFALLNEKLVFSGQLFYTAPDQVTKVVIKPQSERFEIRSDTLYVELADGSKYKLLLSNYPLLEIFAEAYRGILSGNIKVLKKFYDLEFTGDYNNWVLTLTPVEEEAQEYVESVVMYGKAAQLEKILTLENGGDKSLMQIIRPARGKK